MAYLPKRFPMLIGRDPVGGPGFKTTIATVDSGGEQRNGVWTRSRHKGDISHAIKSDTDFEEVGAHFRMSRARLHYSRLREWADYVCKRADGVAVELSSTTFQAHKAYGDIEGFIELRRITRIYSTASLFVWISGALKTITTDYTVDIETGIITIPSAPDPEDIELAFEFDIPARYDTDELQATLVQVKRGSTEESYHSWKSVPWIEVREGVDP